MGWLPVPNPVAFTVFGISIRWYAICLTVGTMFALFIASKRANKKGLSTDRLLDYFIWCAPAGIIGARLYYVIFQWSYYGSHLNQILNFRGGGLAIHGALIGIVIAMYFVSKHYKEDMLVWLDLIAVVVPLGQAIGRWGNYFNSEAHGTATTLPWAIYADGEWVHPTFLYESVWCFLLFLFLLWFDNKGHQKFKGQLTCLYMILYSLERIFVEGLRTDSLYIGPFRQAQILSACVIIAGVVLYIIFSKKFNFEKLASEKASSASENEITENAEEQTE